MTDRVDERSGAGLTIAVVVGVLTAAGAAYLLLHGNAALLEALRVRGKADAMRMVTVLSPLLAGHGALYLASASLHFGLALGWAASSVALLVQRPWGRTLGLWVGAAAMLLGGVVAFVDARALGCFSMFGISPLFALIALAVLACCAQPTAQPAEQAEADPADG